MKRFLFFLVITLPLLAGAQAADTRSKLISDIQGTPVYISFNTTYNVEGSPFFPAEYCNATIKVQRGKKYEDVAVKVNLQSNEIYVKFADAVEIVATVPLEYIEFNGCNDGKKTSFRSGFPAIEKQTETSYYQVLSEGNITLLKNFNTTFRDQTTYGSSSVTRTFESSPLYYAYSAAGVMVRLKDNAAVLQLFPAQKSEVEKFINNENIRIKREADVVKLFVFLNTIGTRKS